VHASCHVQDALQRAFDVDMSGNTSQAAKLYSMACTAMAEGLALPVQGTGEQCWGGVCSGMCAHGVCRHRDLIIGSCIHAMHPCQRCSLVLLQVWDLWRTQTAPASMNWLHGRSVRWQGGWPIAVAAAGLGCHCQACLSCRLQYLQSGQVRHGERAPSPVRPDSVAPAGGTWQGAKNPRRNAVQGARRSTGSDGGATGVHPGSQTCG
jgi:hypothetical protein